MELSVHEALRMGIAAHEAGQLADADKFYAEILKSDPHQPDANHHSGILMVTSGKPLEALPFFKRALAATPSRGEFWLSYIDTLISVGRISDAKAVLGQAKGKGAQGERFELLEQRLSRPVRSNDSSSSLKEQPTSPLQRNIEGNVQIREVLAVAKQKLKKGLVDDAKNSYLDILRSYPLNKKALAGLKSLQNDDVGGLKDPPQNELEPLLNLYNQGMLQNALSMASTMQEAFPTSVVICNLLGVINAGLGNFEQAIFNYARALEIKPDFAEAHCNMGLARASQGGFGAAIKSYKRALKIRPDYAEVYNNMGIALHAQGSSDAAIHNFKKSLKLKPDYADAYYNIGNTLREQGDLGSAIVKFKQALTLRPDHAMAHNNMGIALSALGNSRAAIESYQRALAIFPSYVEAYNNIGIAFRQKGDLSAALEYYRMAQKIQPDSAELHNNIGITQQEKGDSYAAVESYKQAITLRPDYAEGYKNMGIALSAIGDYEGSTACYEQAIVLFQEKSSELELTQSLLLKTLYSLGDRNRFSKYLDHLSGLGQRNALIGSLSCRATGRDGIARTNDFCNEPMLYIHKTSLLECCDFEGVFVEPAKAILSSEKVGEKYQPLLSNGYQTAGNIFSIETVSLGSIKEIISAEIEKYRNQFRDSSEGMIRFWPTKYTINGWLVSMKNGGVIRPHMHENGWISGSIYINVPRSHGKDSGNLVLCIEEPQNVVAGTTEAQKIINVDTGTLCLFPSSLQHYTIPFNASEERIVLAFDVIPK